MLSIEMLESIKEVAYKYASHYAQEFLYKVEDRHLSFKEHYESLKFKKKFYYEIIYEEDSFLNYLNDERRKMIHPYLNEEELEEKSEELEESLLKEVRKHYCKYFSDYYLELLSEKEEEYLEEIEYEREDEEYYVKRKYIGEEAEAGGAISEKDRVILIAGSKKKQLHCIEKLKKLREVKEEIKTVSR